MNRSLTLAALLSGALALGAAATAGEKSGKAPKEKGPVNTKCPVSGDDIDAAHTAEYKGQTVAFCCDHCVDDFKKDPKKFAKEVEKQSKQAEKEKKPAK